MNSTQPKEVNNYEESQDSAAVTDSIEEAIEPEIDGEQPTVSRATLYASLHNYSDMHSILPRLRFCNDIFRELVDLKDAVAELKGAVAALQQDKHEACARISVLEAVKHRKRKRV